MLSFSWLLALAPALGLALNVIVQIVTFRALRRRSLLKSIVVGFAGGLLLVAILSFYCCHRLPGTSLDLIGRLLANCATSCALGYGYFHFLNLGQTARRVRILREFVEAQRPLTRDEVLARYNADTILQLRLARLLATGQLSAINGRLVARRSTVLVMARVIGWMKSVLLGAGSDLPGDVRVRSNHPAAPLRARSPRRSASRSRFT
jgi:hypothetical protein